MFFQVHILYFSWYIGSAIYLGRVNCHALIQWTQDHKVMKHSTRIVNKGTMEHCCCRISHLKHVKVVHVTHQIAYEFPRLLRA